MYRDLFKKLGKISLIGIAWVFVLSIRMDGRPLFFYAHDFFVDNILVRTVTEETQAIWHKVKRTARASMEEVQEPQKSL